MHSRIDSIKQSVLRTVSIGKTVLLVGQVNRSVSSAVKPTCKVRIHVAVHFLKSIFFNSFPSSY